VPFLAGAWWVAIVGAAIVAQAQLVDAGVSAGSVLTSSLGPAIAGRTLPLGVVAAGIVLVWRRPGRMRNGALVIVVGASAGMLGVAAASHAADPSRSALAMAAQWLHLLAVGVWLGGLAALLVALAAAPGEARGRWARRFSGIALGGLGVVALTGVVRAADEVGSLDALLQTDYGRLVLAKAALLLLLAALGMVQRRRGIPMAASGARTLRRVGSLEVAVAVVAMLLAATLVNLVPPVSAGAVETGGQAEPWTGPRAAAGQDATGSMHATLRLSPGTAGFDTFLLDVADAAGAPVSDASVELWFVPATRPTQPPAVLRLDTAGEGRYLGRGTQLSTEGTWQVTAQVAREGSTAEVPLIVRTAIPVQRIDVVHTPGLPDISSVHLVGGGTLQVYVDPGRAGDNEVHATFFDTSGGELPVTQAWIAVMPSVAAPGSTSGSTSGPSGGPVAPPPPVELSARVLEPGHLVASTRLPAGDAWIVVSAEAPDGASLSAQVPVSVVP
jgi:putative copper export protein